jgi:hypothetical protein
MRIVTFNLRISQIYPGFQFHIYRDFIGVNKSIYNVSLHLNRPLKDYFKSKKKAVATGVCNLYRIVKHFYH